MFFFFGALMACRKRHASRASEPSSQSLRVLLPPPVGRGGRGGRVAVVDTLLIERLDWCFVCLDGGGGVGLLSLAPDSPPRRWKEGGGATNYYDYLVFLFSFFSVYTVDRVFYVSSVEEDSGVSLGGRSQGQAATRSHAIFFKSSPFEKSVC